jgi:hypothetical protein
MRSRQMLAKLDRLDVPSQEPECPDVSLLSPAHQDRVFELFRKNRNSLNEIEPTINRKARDELEGLLADPPVIGPDDKPAGPKIEVPPALVHYWQWNQSTSTWRHYDFWKLKAVQKIRLAELCRYYGWCEGTSPKARMLPLCDWTEQDRDEMTAFLDEIAWPSNKWP